MTGAARLRRRVDRRVYRLLYALERLAFPTDVGPGRLDAGALRRVLVLPNYKVGDLVVATPALAFLRAAAPHARLDVLVSPRNASLLEGDPRVDRVLVHEPLREPWLPVVRRLRRERYDLVVDFVLPHHAREGLISALVAGRRGARVTPFRPTRYWGFFTHRARVPGLERRYMAERLLYAVQAPFGRALPGGPDAAPYPMRLAVAPDAAARAAAFLREAVGGRAFVALNAWASDPVRTLAVAQAAELAAEIARRHPDLAVVFTPPPAAADDARAMADAARLTDGGARVAVLPPSPRLADLVALLARARAVVTPDTANIHLAAAVGRPVVALYTLVATEKIAHWIPSGTPFRAVVVDGPHPLAALDPRRAADALDELLGDAAREAGADRPAPLAAAGA
ncbi:heptosyltransferase I [Gemmatimonadetes bacterium T265]|nr:heptosyltransferase I [Gemmatimonadetes bacterium T265]